MATLAQLKLRLANGWAQTAGLAAALSTIALCVDGRFNGGLSLRSPPWSLLLVVAGVLLLNGQQEALLSALFFSIELRNDLMLQPAAADPATATLMTQRLLLVVLCVWAAHSRTHLQRQRQQLEAGKRQLSQQLQQSLRASALAHELRQPLSELLITSQMLQHRCERQQIQAPQLQEGLEALQTSGQQINNLIGTISQVLQEAPHAEQKQTVDLVNVVQLCLQQVTPQVRASGMELQLRGLEQPVWVPGRQAQHTITCCNLIRNAVEAMETMEQQTQLPRLLIQLHQHDTHVELLVADSGPGLPSTRLSDLVLRSSKPGGMGIGLLAAQLAASRDGGSLKLGRSAELGGAELRLSLPR